MPGLSSPSDERAASSTRRLKLPARHSPASRPHPPAANPDPARTPTIATVSSNAAGYRGVKEAPSPNGHAGDSRMDSHSTSTTSSGGESSPRVSTESQRELPSMDNVLSGGRPDFDAGALGSNQASPPTATSQQQLNAYRERLARDLERQELSARRLSMNQEKTRVSPIMEENITTSPLPTASLTTTSTESGHTIRGGTTPAPIMGTPSYPFPRMAPGTFTPSYLHRPFTALSPTGPPLMSQSMYSSMSMQDQVLSEGSTPVSAFTFNPSGTQHPHDNYDFPTPNLYDLSLMLAAEPGLDAWWATIVQIMKDVYKAERVTLSIPADTTDIENVPWGQKATYNEHQEDELSLGYMAGASGVPSSDHDTSEVPTPDSTLKPGAGVALRPGLPTRHSFTTFENKRNSEESAAFTARRPSNLLRSRSYLPSSSTSAEFSHAQTHLDKGALDEHDAEEQQHIPDWEVSVTNHRVPDGRVLPVLQALDYEADPLIDHTGVMRVLERGRAVALTRSYPYLANRPPSEQSGSQQPGSKPSSSESVKKVKKPRSESMSKLSSILPGSSGSRGSIRGRGQTEKTKAARFEEEVPRPTTPKYEEYEQGPSSPWSQSPAPSPAIRHDPKENPFFSDATVDEESFNPGSGPTDYTGMRPPQAIGVDNSWTVLHIPLTHVLVSRPTNLFKLDLTAIEQKAGSRGREEGGGHDVTNRSNHSSPESSRKNKIAPIAILSVLSPIIPYPNNLRHSLEHLAPHMATSFSLCRHYSNLETELAGIQRRRPNTAGFGAVTAEGIPLESTAYLNAVDIARQQSVPGSMTSPSDYSAVSKSATGSPAGTPGWDQGSLSFLHEKRQPAASPAAIAQGSDSYFSSKQRAGAVRQELRRAESQKSRPNSGSKDNSPSDKRHSRLPSSQTSEGLMGDEEHVGRLLRSPNDSLVNMPRHVSYKDVREAVGSDESALEKPADEPSKLEDSHARHTLLHSYGADFASTFQSLPPSSSLGSRPHLPASLPSRSGSMATSVADMPPPSDKLKGLMLDSLPAHVFVALPQTGEIVWVNSRYLSYRGQTVADLSADPWSSIHNDDREEYLRDWGRSVKTGEQFSRTVRIKRFDGAYRWFYARAVASKDKRGVIMQFLGSYMDIHDQHIAELKAARQEEIEASEAKHRLLANLIPQIIFTATEEDGITFANEQWLSYTGQSFDDSLGLGFMDYVHPEDLAKCRIPTDHPPTPLDRKREPDIKPYQESVSSSASKVTLTQDSNLRGVHQALSRNNSSSSSSVYELPTADLTELARKGVIKVGTDSNGRLSYTTEVRLRSKSGEYRWHLIRCVEIDTIDFGSGASSYFGSATDINDHKLLEAKLKEAMESKGRFLSNMSHEIRTPLIGISGMVTFLQDTKLNEEQRDYTNTIQTSANSLIMIINDILDLSKVDAGMMKLKYEWFHTRSLIEDVNELVSTMAIAKGLELNYLVEADVPAWVKGDKVRIRQVLLNVIGNAIKFTTAGEVFSKCKVYTRNDARFEDHEIMLEFAITDTGRGFSQTEAELIFKPFSQIDGSSTRQHGGSGLGLVISRQLVELHGGQMEGSAIPGRGSTFTFTARFTLPTEEDHPHLPESPNMWGPSRHVSPLTKPLHTPRLPRTLEGLSPDVGDVSSPTVTSTGSSNPSVQSGRSHVTDRSSVTSVNTGLARFSEAAKASGQDLSQMKLEMPSGRSSPGRTVTPGDIPSSGRSPEEFRPPMYSILILCPQLHSREATTAHIEMTLPKDVPHQITALATVEEAQELIGGEDPINFTHIVINLKSAEAIIDLMDRITKSQKIDKTTILVLSDSVQRQAVLKLAADTEHEKLFTEHLVTFIYKPVKPSRFAVIFDPDKVQDLSIDRNRSTAQRMVENQKASYQEIERRMGHKGYKVLLVEDNPVNQKVLMKYLNKIGVDVEVAVDGVECTDTVLSKPHQHYSLILCDLHMPRKDGYQACRDIRAWEKAAKLPKMPIIALSANVMSDVQEKCVAAGFSDYVTKPVDFIDLSRAMAKFF